MCRPALDSYSYMPEEMRAYMRNYGFSFSKRACEWAVNHMERRSGVSGKTEPIEPYSKEKAEELLTKHGIKLENNIGYNFVYVLNMAVADFYKSSIKDEKDLAQFVKDVIDDVDDVPENLFRCFIYKIEGKGMPIPWEDWL